MKGGGVDESSFGESAELPELEPIEVVRTLLDVVFIAMMLEVKHLVTPEGGSSFGSGNEVSNEFLFATLLGGTVVTENLEHNCVRRNNGKLVLEIVLVLIGPAVDVIGLNLDLEGPVVVLNGVTVLIELGKLHD